MKRLHLAAAACAAVTGMLFATAPRADEGKAEDPTVQRAIHVCAACHGEGGRSTAAVYPRLAGQMPMYTIAQLKAFRDQKRAELDPQAYMWGVSALLDDATIAGLADYFAQQTPAPGVVRNPGRVNAGKKIFEEGLPGKGVRPCASCHGDHAEGASVFPRLAGQHADYVLRQLTEFGTRLRPHGVLMKNETANMTPSEKRAVAEYVQSL